MQGVNVSHYLLQTLHAQLYNVTLMSNIHWVIVQTETVATSSEFLSIFFSLNVYTSPN